MDSVIKIFFRGMSVIRIRTQHNGNTKGIQNLNGLKSLKELEDEGIVHTRIRADTQVKQFHAGQVFEYLKNNLKLKTNQCLLVLTNADLYPKEGWTFVFGMTK
jgi:predicted Zn-dependent protease